MKPTIRIHDIATNEVIDREMTNTEYADYQRQEATDNAKAEAQAQAATDKAAILAKLGITEAEARLLMGGN